MGYSVDVGVDQAVAHRESQGGDIVNRPPYKPRAHRRARVLKASVRQSASGQLPIHIDRGHGPEEEDHNRPIQARSLTVKVCHRDTLAITNDEPKLRLRKGFIK